MKQLFQKITLAFASLLLMASCDDNTGMMGIYDSIDQISTSMDAFDVSTKSVAIGSVIADNTNAYLGKVRDPETGAIIEADFAAQFYCHENYTLPKKDSMVGNVNIDAATGDTISIEYGVVQCDSVEIRVYLNSFYGDANNPMKLEVYELDEKVVMEENEHYYTDVDLSKYVKGTTPIATKVFTATDFSVSEDTREEGTYTPNIRIMLPASLGQRIMERIYAKPTSLQDSYHFIREVFPGLYFRATGGEGTMLHTLVTTLNIYYDYADSKNSKKIYQGVTRFAATPEVIQSTHFSNGGVDALLAENDYTYLKTPAGICTEMTLPIDEVFDKHPYDSVSKAQIILQRYNKEQDKYQLGTPSYLLMVRKQDRNTFFENNEVSNSRTSYVTSFNSSRNAYAFDNICRLLAYCKHEKIEAARREGITEEEWAAKNPDWNKVMLIPVVVSSNSNGNITSVSHDMDMNSVKLIGGNNKLRMDIVYSKFARE